MVKSVRGAYGGYKLAKESCQKLWQETSFVCLKGRSNLVEGLDDDDIPQRELWKRIGDAIRGVLDPYDNQRLN